MGNDRVPNARGQMVVLKSQEPGGHNYGNKWQSLSEVGWPHLCNTTEMVKGPQSSLQDRWATNKGRLGPYEEGPCNSEATVISNNYPRPFSKLLMVIYSG